MTFFRMALLTAIGTLVLAMFAVVTALYARKAFREQSREVAAIEQQVKDEQEVTRQQAELLEVQTEQLGVFRAQLEDQRSVSARQTEVLELQAAELRESLEERRREAESRRSAQASGVFLILNLTPRDIRVPGQPNVEITAEVVNTSDQPAYSAQIMWPNNPAPSYAWAPIHESLGDVLPGKRIRMTRSYPHDWNRDLSDLAFTDAAGVTWTRRPGGYLAEE